jgi:hypothetical protein
MNPAMMNHLRLQQIAQQNKHQPDATTTDPNNVVSYWKDYVAVDGRRYWCNEVSFKSTYDKPFCLKTPEERAIPDCPWREYKTDGKAYYSDGKESVWVMPEAYKTWKEKIEQIEEKKRLEDSAKGNKKRDRDSTGGGANDGGGASSSSAFAGGGGRGHSSGGGGGNASRNKDKALADATDELIKEAAIKYAQSSPEEAAAAFTELLWELKVSSAAKFKDVECMCSQDVRWHALSSTGDKKQCLAEYQTKKLKADKDLLKIKVNKALSLSPFRSRSFSHCVLRSSSNPAPSPSRLESSATRFCSCSPRTQISTSTRSGGTQRTSFRAMHGTRTSRACTRRRSSSKTSW